MKNLLFYLLFLVSISAYCQTDCNKLQSNFSSYNEAFKKIKSTTFKFTDYANTSKSSWIRGASFYSCDMKFGYLIIQTDDGNYIHKNVPTNIWNSFKHAKSFGSYYNKNIKNRYQL